MSTSDNTNKEKLNISKGELDHQDFFKILVIASQRALKSDELNKFFAEWKEGGWSVDLGQPNYNLIFSHEFAKAFWGEKHTGLSGCDSCGDYEELAVKDFIDERCYVVHLTHMVKFDNPIDYLRKFVEL